MSKKVNTYGIRIKYKILCFTLTENVEFTRQKDLREYKLQHIAKKKGLERYKGHKILSIIEYKG